MLVKFEQNRMVRNIESIHKIVCFLKTNKQTKKRFLNHFWQSVDAILKDVSVAETIDSKLLIWKLPSFSIPKLTVVWHV